MYSRKSHRLIGILLLLPFLAWASTAIFFLVRPAYEQAYAQLSVRQLPFDEPLLLTPQPDWQEMRALRTVLGEHLLVRTTDGWQHLEARNLTPFDVPDQDALTRLLSDAFTRNPDRYGEITQIDGNRIVTSTDVHITMNWNNLSFQQSGRDTRLINRIYDIHYLRWTGYRPFDQVFGLFGLGLLIYMTYSGFRMAFRGRR